MAAECANIQDSEQNSSQNLQDGNERFSLPSSLLRKLMQMKLCDEECQSLKCRQEKENMRTAIMRLADAFNDIYDAYSKQDKTITEIIQMANGLCTNFNIPQKFEYSASEEKAKLNEMARMIRLYFMKTPRRNKRKQGNEVDENGLKDEKMSEINCHFLDDDGIFDTKMETPNGVTGGTTHKINGVMAPTQENLRRLQNGMASGHTYGFNRETPRYHSSPEPKRNRPNISHPAVNGTSRIFEEPSTSGSAAPQRVNIPPRQTVRSVMATAHQSNPPLYSPLTVNTVNGSCVAPPINGCRPLITIRGAPNIGAGSGYATLKQHLNNPSPLLTTLNTRNVAPTHLLSRSPQRRFNHSHGSSNGYSTMSTMQIANGEPSLNHMGVGSKSIRENARSQQQVDVKVVENPEGGCNLYILQEHNRRYLAIEQIPFATPAGVAYSHPLPLPRLKSTQTSETVPDVNSFQATIKYNENGACVVNLLLKYRYIGDNQKLYLYYYLSDAKSPMPHAPVWEDGSEFTCRETGLSVKLEFVDIKESEVLFLSFRIGTSPTVKGKFTIPVAIQVGRAHDGVMINADFAYFRDKEKQMENGKESKPQAPAQQVNNSAVHNNDEIVVLE